MVLYHSKSNPETEIDTRILKNCCDRFDCFFFFFEKCERALGIWAWRAIVFLTCNNLFYGSLEEMIVQKNAYNTGLVYNVSEWSKTLLGPFPDEIVTSGQLVLKNSLWWKKDQNHQRKSFHWWNSWCWLARVEKLMTMKKGPVSLSWNLGNVS